MTGEKNYPTPGKRVDKNKIERCWEIIGKP